MNFRTERSRKRGDQHLDMTPLIDVVFLLLIFFLITSNYVQERRPNIPIEVPSATTGEKRADLMNVIVHISRTGDLFLDRKPLESIEELGEALRSVKSRAPNTLVLIRCDAQAPFGSSVQVMDLARRLGLERFGIVTQEPE